MQLDPLEFQVKTEALSEAIDKIGVLQQAVQKLSKDTSSQSDLQVAKETNKVLIENAKAQASLIAIETKRIENQKKLQKAQDDTGKSSEASGEKSKDKIEEIITKLQLLEKYMGQGFTRGFATTMSQVEMLGGATAVQMEKITSAMTDLGKHMRNPFDDAIGPIQSINRELEKVHARGRLAAEGIELTKKQLEEFSRITSSIESQQKSRGLNLFDASVITETTAHIKKAQDEYVAKAKEYNASIQKEMVVGKSVHSTEGNNATALFIKDQEAKVKALARAEEMLARLDNKIKQSTAEDPLSQSAANQLFTYTKMLEKAGLTAQQSGVLIKEFSTKQHEAAKLALSDEEKKIKHLAASLAPQVTDVTVGLMTGQNPLTVFLQQGGQIRDQIGQSRVATEDLGKVFKLTITGMIDMVMAMSAALIKFMVSPMGLVLVAVSAVVAALSVFSGEMLKSEKQTVEITKALVGSGNAAGATAEQMKSMAKEASAASGISFDKSVGAMIEFAKTGEMTKEEFVQAAEAALLYERYMGVSVAESAKQLKELAKDPLKAVMKITEESGYFTTEIIRQVAELERLGLKEEAGALAKAEYAKATKAAAEEVRESMGYLLKFFDSVGLAASWMWDKITGVGAVQGLDKKIERAVADIQSLSNAQAGQQGKGVFAIDYKSDIETAAKDLQTLLDTQGAIQKKATDQQANRGLSKDQADIEALTNKNRITPDKKIEESAKAVQLYISVINDAAVKGSDEVAAAIARRDKLLHDIATGKKGDPKPKAVKDTLESLNLNLDNQTQQDEKQYQLKLRGIDNFTKQEQTRLQNSLTAKEITQGEFMVRELAMIASGENQKTALIDEQRITRANDLARDATTLTERYNEFVDANKSTAGFAEKNKDELEKLRSKVADLGRAYETSTVAMDEQASKAKELSKTLYDKQYAVLAGSIRSAKEELVKFTIAEDKLKEQRKTQVEVEDKLRYASPEQAAYIQASATETARLTTEVQKYNEEIRLQTENVNGAVNAGEKERELLGYITVDTQKLIDKQRELQAVKEQNRDTVAGTINSASSIAGNAAVVKLQKDNLKTLSDGIAASVETGLFEGGEAGSKSLRTLVEAELRKPITIFINAVISGMVNSASGVVGGAATSAGNSAMNWLSGASGAKTAYGWGSSFLGSASATGSAGTVGAMTGAQTSAMTSSLNGAGYMGSTGNSAFSTMTPYAYIGAAMMANSSLYDAGYKWQDQAAIADPGMGLTTNLLTGLGMSDKGASILTGNAIEQAIFSKIKGLFTGPQAATTMGAAQGTYDASGKLISSQAIDVGQSDAMVKNATARADIFAQSYYSLANSLGITGVGTTFGFNSNTGRDGQNENVDFRVKAGTATYNSGEIGRTDTTAITLATSRAMITALQASEMPKYLEGVFDGLVASTATQQQLDDVTALAQTYKAFHDTLVLLPFENLKDMSYATAKALVEAAGGMEAFGTKLQSYYSNYYSAEEQKAQTVKNINATLIGTGFDAATATRETFRKLVESQDVTTESGRKTYTALMNVSEAFAGITPALDSTTTSLKDLLDVVTKSANTAFTALKASVDLEKTKATELYTTKLNAYNLALTSTTDSISKLTSLASTLKSTLSSLNIINSDQQQRISAQADIKAALIQAQAGGGLPLNNELTTALSTITKPSEGLFSTFTEYARDFYKTSSDIQALSDLTGTQLTLEEQNLNAIKSQVTLLEKTYNASIKYLDSILTNAQSQLDAINGVTVGVFTLVDAMKDMNANLASLFANRTSQSLSTSAGTGVVVGGGGVMNAADATARLGTIKEYVQGLNWGSDEADTASAKLLAQAAMSTGVTQREIADSMNLPLKDVEALFARSGIPAFEVGTNYVPRDMVAQIHEGEAIIPKAYNPDANGMNAALVDEIRALRVQVQDLQASNRETAMSTRNTDKTLVRVTQGGEAMQTQVI